ncbi:iron-containing alcohol dehydrogenase [Brevibacillus sp. H7]|uniref:iron-containing alcohol dehydrogenase n=1 Tax=Brevibacillus sp. H7 TaxID=3349138 RepID=UPI003806DBFB
MITTLQIPSRVITGVGSVSRLQEEITRLGGTNVLLLCDVILVDNGIISQVTEQLQLPYTLYSHIIPEPPISSFEETLAFAKQGEYDVILAVGGGSTIDVAKLVSVMMTNEGSVRDYFGVNLIPKEGMPLIAVPTTAGTGSEVTPISILTLEEEAVKKGIVSPYLIPKTAILDAALTTSMPKAVTAATGLDAFVHALEGYLSMGPNRSQLTDAFCLEAMSVIWKNIRRAYCNGDDLEARSQMLYAAMVAGVGFANAGVGAVHALAYPLGARFHVSHGVANSLLLPYVMKWNKVACLERFVNVAQTIGLPTTGKTARALADEVIEEIVVLSRELGIPQRLREVGVKEEDLKGMAEAASKEQRLLQNNPRKLSPDDIYQIYKEAW